MSRASPVRWRVVTISLVPFVWVVGLAGSLAGHYFHECAWVASHPAGVVTEDDMIALGDYPNVLAGWILLGWIPVLMGLVITRRKRKKIQAEQGEAGQPPLAALSTGIGSNLNPNPASNPRPR